MADVPAALKDWSATASSNSPTDATTIGSGLADNFQALQAVVRGDLATKGSDIASSAAPDVAAVQGLYHDLTGTNTVTGLGTGSAGIWKIIQFDSTPQLTHSTALALPGAANITAAAGDVGIFFCEASNIWRCVSYFRAANQPTQDASDTVKGVIEYAVQSEMETGTSTTLAVTPGRQHFHASAAKAWVKSDYTSTPLASYNLTSITDSGTGDQTFTWATDFSSADYSVVSTVIGGAGGTAALTYVAQTTAPAAGTVRVQTVKVSDGTNVDANALCVVAFGDF